MVSPPKNTGADGSFRAGQNRKNQAEIQPAFTPKNAA
jgi:hypothetical protein